ncbi:MAG: aminotransferase class V-fold PLP-dependent enzyme [Phycisphaerales bacterium]|nr:aminotransferase class V-fold PLP-dependent enzyme [Phycisphaerales bacterium]
MGDTTPTPDPFAPVSRGAWTLDPEWAFLNHGSYGGAPRAVLDEQAALRARLERQPVKFMRELEPMLDEARCGAAAFVGADPDDIAFVRNATEGVNAVLRSLEFRPGDEILVTDHEYNACRNAADFVAERTGAVVVCADVPRGLGAPGDVVDRVASRVTARTRLAMISHITSPTGLMWPARDITRALQGRGVEVLIDGAHAPGMTALDVNEIGADYYAANFHKWTCAPKGAAMLHVRRDRQARIHPAVISHGRNDPRTDRSRFRLEFDWTGTADPTPALCVPGAIAAVGAMLEGGWPAVMRANRAKALAGRAMVSAAIDAPPPVPEAFIGSLAAVELPDRVFPGASAMEVKARLEAALVEVPVIQRPDGSRLVRLSAHLYNRREEYERLAVALAAGMR